jgi:tetratricopeptide (TPR) repeat protein
LRLHEGGEVHAARQAYESILAEEPRHFDALHLLGVVCAQMGEHQIAVDLLSKAVHLNKSHAVAHNNLGNAQAELKNWHAALESYNQAVKLNPRYALAYFYRGIPLEDLGNFDAALATYQKAIQIDAAYFQAYSNCGLIFQKMRCGDEALAQYARAIQSNPNYAEAYYNRGTYFMEMKRYGEAIVEFDRALQISPTFADAYWNKSITHLLMGEWAAAWDLYPWRWRISELESEDPKPPLYPDRFQHASNKPEKQKVFVWAEQGVGDEIFHASMLSEAAAHFAALTVQIDPRLISLFERSIPGVNFVDKSDPVDLHSFDLHLAHGDLGYFFRRTADDFRRVQSRYLCTDVSRVDALRKGLKADDRLLCGISWRSKNKRIGNSKSVGLEKLLPVLRNPNIRFVNLQYGHTVDELEAFTNEYGVEISSCPSVDNFSDLDGHAALIDACDFIVTVSNTTAHIAGALGKPAHVMLAQGDGRLWFWANRYGTQSMWYPSAHIYEQTRWGEWDDVVSSIDAILSEKYLGQ